MQSAKDSVRALHSLLTRRKRFTNGSSPLGLDLAYITDRVIVCSFPYELPLFFSRNTAGDLLKFLETTHKDHYKLYNLCSERQYDHTKFKGRVAEFLINVNEAPQLYTIYSFIKDVNIWLDADPMNVVCVHCDNGRDRTGMMVSAWLLQTKRCLTASHAITFFASVRGGMSPCVTVPSQRRVLTEKMPSIKLVVLEKITIYTVPMFNLRGGCSPWFSISKLNKSIFYSKSLEGKRGKMSIDFECNFIQLQGDIVITFFDGKFSRLMFRISFHSSFIRGKTVTFYPRDIDGPHADTNHKNFNPEFKVTLHFSNVALLPAEQISADDVIPQTKKYTFDDVLNIPTLRESFRTYLESTRCTENLDFWRNVQRYKESYVVSAAKSVATKIHNKYLVRYSPDEVNVSGEAKADVAAAVTADVPPRNLFDLAEREIYSLMRNDSYPRFIISDLFFKACADLSDYVVSDPTRSPVGISSKSFRANTTTASNSSEKISVPKRNLTSASDPSPSSIYPLSDEDVIVPIEKYDYSSPFKHSPELKGKTPQKEPVKRDIETTPRPKPQNDDLLKRENSGKQELIVTKNSNASRPISPPPSSKSSFLSFFNPATSPSPSPSPSPREGDSKRGDFIKGDYRSRITPSPSDLGISSLTRSHPPLESGESSNTFRREPVSSPAIYVQPPLLSNSSPAAFVNLQSRSTNPLNANTTITNTSLDNIHKPTNASPSPPALQAVSTRRKQEGSLHSSSTLLRPSSPSEVNQSSSKPHPRPPNSTQSSPESLPSRKSVAKHVQAIQERPGSILLSHSTSEPNISVNYTLSPQPNKVNLNSKSDDGSDSFRVRSPAPSLQVHKPQNTDSQEQRSPGPSSPLSSSGNHIMLPILFSGTLSPHSDIPPRPETPSSFSPSVLSFERSIPHELPTHQISSHPPQHPTTYETVVEQSETLRVMENIKLVCVECRQQIGNKDVVVSFMHHYYHWACVRCHKCRQPLSSDCVIAGDKPFCGKCDDDFFNKCNACGIAITETSEEQRIDDEGKINCWHRKCFACWICGVTSNSECPIERFAGDNKLYCVFHHPEPKTVPVMSAQDIREDALEESQDHCDDFSSDDDSPPPSPPSSPPPNLPTQSILPIPSLSLCPSSRASPYKPLPATPTTQPAAPRKPRKPLPPLPLRRPTVVATPPSSHSHPRTSTTTTRGPLQRHVIHNPNPDDAYFAGTCAACSQRIPKSGNLLLAGGSQYHPTCFNCCVCASPITGAYQEHEGSVYCPAHRMVPWKNNKCAGCSGVIGPGVYVVVQDNGEEKYHVQCFTCKLCGLQFGTEHSYYNVWGGHICVQCYTATCEVKRKSRLYRR